MYSTAAVVIDINKTIIYARDKNNKIIARQLVAWSEEKQLVCFSVYPLELKEAILDLFIEYNYQLADFLTIKVYKSNDDKYDYTIKNIISTDWWDDLPWDIY